MKEIKLVKKAIKGNKKAFEELLILHSDQLYRTAYLYVRNREDALDVIQETAYKGLRAIGQLRDEKYFLTWLTKIMIHCAYDAIKKKKKEISVDKMIERTPAKEDIREVALDLVDAIDRLNDHYRNAVILFYYQDLPISEVAKLMNIPENTVKTYLYRGKSELKKLLGGNQYHGEESFF